MNTQKEETSGKDWWHPHPPLLLYVYVHFLPTSLHLSCMWSGCFGLYNWPMLCQTITLYFYSCSTCISIVPAAFLYLLYVPTFFLSLGPCQACFHKFSLASLASVLEMTSSTLFRRKFFFFFCITSEWWWGFVNINSLYHVYNVSLIRKLSLLCFSVCYFPDVLLSGMW